MPTQGLDLRSLLATARQVLITLAFIIKEPIPSKVDARQGRFWSFFARVLAVFLRGLPHVLIESSFCRALQSPCRSLLDPYWAFAGLTIQFRALVLPGVEEIRGRRIRSANLRKLSAQIIVYLQYSSLGSEYRQMSHGCSSKITTPLH